MVAAQSRSCCSDRTTPCAWRHARVAWLMVTRAGKDGAGMAAEEGAEEGAVVGAAERAAASGLPCFWFSVFLRVFYGGSSFCCVAVYRYLVLLYYNIYISGTRMCSLLVGFGFGHSWNAISRPCARSWIIGIRVLSFTGETHRWQRSLAGSRSLASCIALVRSHASNAVHGDSTQACVSTCNLFVRFSAPLAQQRR
jgi:hypothetical protein